MLANQRIQQLFATQKAYIAYLTAGDGGINNTLTYALALIAGGVNMLEIGIPFSDPIADGPVIQRAAARALANHTTLKDIIWLITEIRKQSDIPLILFSYYNPILTAMQSDFLATVKLAGIDGLLIVDCPIEESHHLHQECIAKHIAPIYVITPTTSLARLKKIDRYGQGFLYYTSRKGITGMHQGLSENFTKNIQEVKAQVKLPVVVGFGISNQYMTEEVLRYADGVVVGSLFVKAIEDQMSPAALTQLTQTLYPANNRKRYDFSS